MYRNLRRIVSLLIVFILFSVFMCGLSPSASAATVNISVGLTPYFPPYQFIDDSGRLSGLHVDIMDYIAKKEGLIVEYIMFDSKSACREALDKGEIDLILGSQRSNSSWLSNDISSGTLCLLSQSSFADSINDIKSHSLGVYEFGTASSMLLSKLFGTTMLCVSNQEDVLNELEANRAQYAVGIKESMLYQLDQNNLSSTYAILTNYLAKLDFAIEVRENDNMLLRSLNQGIAALRGSGEYDRLYSKWVIDDEATYMHEFIRTATIVLACLTIPVAIYVLFSVLMHRELRKQVNIRTEELSKANQQLAQQFTQLEHESDFRNKIIHYSKLGMILFDREFKIILINNSACRITGTSNTVGDDVRGIPVYGEILSKYGNEIFCKSGDVFQDTIIIERRNLDNIAFELHYRYTMQQIYKKSTVAGLLLSVEDVTDEHERSQKLFEEEKSESLNKMIAGIAHEIRNPLMAIRTFASVASEGDMDQEFIDNFSRFVPSEIDRINKLIESLINYAAPFTGEKTVVDMNAVLADCSFFAASIEDNPKICISTSADSSGTAYIYANRDQIKQVIINIIVNGLDSMREKLDKYPEITCLNMYLCLKCDSDNVELSIIDEGCGMSKEAINRCRDAFFTTKSHGSGLGLALCDQYIRSNKGSMDIESVEGKYTNIRLLFRRIEN